jgi:hypothetical protein
MWKDREKEKEERKKKISDNPSPRESITATNPFNRSDCSYTGAKQQQQLTVMTAKPLLYSYNCIQLSF